MNRYDDAIYRGTMPRPPAPTEVPAAPGTSYYWDRRAEGHDHATACRLAARDMGSALGSLRAVGMI